MKYPKIILCLSLLLVIAACQSSETAAVTTTTTPTISSFTASPSTIEEGESTTLSWSISNADTASIDQGIGSIAASSTLSVSPTTTTTYTLTAGNKDGTVTSTATVTVTEVASFVIDSDISVGTKSSGHPYVYGYVKNIGSATGYDVQIEWWAFSDPDRITIIDHANGFATDFGDIKSGQRAYFEAEFINLTSLSQIKSLDYKITWLNRSSSLGLQQGIAQGWLIR
jgi:hypothetical protein